MKPMLGGLTAVLLTALPPGVLAVEEADYRVLQQEGAIELREYASSIVAETFVEADFEDAGNRAFRRLFRYIDGDNETQQEIAMTAPVSQTVASEKIAMTAPVGQRQEGGGWVVSFMMPAAYTMETIPRPSDPEVRLRALPAYRAVAIRYSGFWSEARYREHLEELKAWLDQQGLQTAGDPVWARYDPPFKPWFMRRNEIIIPVL